MILYPYIIFANVDHIKGTEDNYIQYNKDI